MFDDDEEDEEDQSIISKNLSERSKIIHNRLNNILEEKKKDLEKQLADPDLYTDTDKVTQLTENYEKVKANLSEKSDLWEQKVEELEAVG